MRVRPEAIVNEPTSLPQHDTPEAMKAATERDRTVRVQGNAYLLSAAEAAGVRRYILQSTAFFAPVLDWPAKTPHSPSKPLLFVTDSSTDRALGSRRTTRLRGASNGKAKRELNFQPRPLEWLSA